VYPLCKNDFPDKFTSNDEFAKFDIWFLEYGDPNIWFPNCMLHIIRCPDPVTASATAVGESTWLEGMYKESEQKLESALRLGSDPKMADAYHRAFARNGERGAAQFGVEDIKAMARKKYVSPWEMAFECAFLGNDDKEEILKFLEAAYQERSPWIVFIQNEPVFDFLHSDPRYRALIKKIGLPPAY
jgi:hypothetical protein